MPDGSVVRRAGGGIGTKSPICRLCHGSHFVLGSNAWAGQENMAEQVATALRAECSSTKREGRTVGAPLRVLIEAPDGPEGTTIWQVLRDSGYETLWCPGPAGPPESWCPLMGGRRCDLVASADVIVSSLGFGHSTCREVLAKLHSLHPEARVVVEASPSAARKWSPVLGGYQVVLSPVSARSLLDAVERAARVVSEDGREKT